MRTTIELQNMEFWGHHGCYDLEQKVGMRFSVDVTIEAEVCDSPVQDSLEGSVNYLLVYQLVKSQMEIRSKTIENVAYRIVERCKEEFEGIEKVRVRVAKIAPSLGGKVEQAAVVIEG